MAALYGAEASGGLTWTRLEYATGLARSTLNRHCNELEKKGEYEDAVRAYEDAIRLGMQDFPRAHLYRARANLDLRKYDDAIAQYTKFIDEFGLEKSCRY